MFDDNIGSCASHDLIFASFCSLRVSLPITAVHDLTMCNTIMRLYDPRAIFYCLEAIQPNPLSNLEVVCSQVVLTSDTT